MSTSPIGSWTRKPAAGSVYAPPASVRCLRARDYIPRFRRPRRCLRPFRPRRAILTPPFPRHTTRYRTLSVGRCRASRDDGRAAVSFVYGLSPFQNTKGRMQCSKAFKTPDRCTRPLRCPLCAFALRVMLESSLPAFPRKCQIPGIPPCRWASCASICCCGDWPPCVCASSAWSMEGASVVLSGGPPAPTRRPGRCGSCALGAFGFFC